MPMTYMELAHELASQGYTREEFASVLKELTGEDYYAADPNTYIKGDFGTGIEEGTTPLQSGAPLEESGPRSVTVGRPEPPLQTVPPAFDLPVAVQMQREGERQRVEQWRARQLAAEQPSPTEWTYPDAPKTAAGEPVPVMTQAEIARYPTQVQPYLMEKYGYAGREAPVRTMTTQELAGVAGRPIGTLKYPESYQQTLAATQALEQDPESIYREEPTVEEPERPMPSAMAMSGRFPPRAMFEGPPVPEGPERPSYEGRLPSAVAEHMEGRRLAEGQLEEVPYRSADYRGQDYVTRLDTGPGDAPLLAAVAEKKRKGELREEFYEKAERPPVGPIDFIKAAADPFDFAGTVMDNDSISTWGSAMWERFIQLFEVTVEKAVEGDLRLERLIRPEEWNGDADMEYLLPTGWQTITSGDRRNFDRLWDMQDEEVVEGLVENMASTEAKAALYPFLTNARKSVGNLANGLWDIGVSLVGGNIPEAVWREMDPKERKRMLEEQAHEAIDEMFGKGMATFAITSLSNPAAAVEVYPAELSFIMYRPMKALARPAGRKFVMEMDALLEWQGAKGPVRAAIATGIKRAASATKRALADPAAHYTKGGEEFLEQTGREAILAEEAIGEGMDVVTRSIVEETAAGRPPEVVEAPPVVPDVPSPKHPGTFTARATGGEPLVRKADIAAKLEEWRAYEAHLEHNPGRVLHTTAAGPGGTLRRVEVLGPGEVPAATRSAGREASRGMTLEQVKAEVRRLEGLLEERAAATVLPEAEVPIRKKLADPAAEEALSSAEGVVSEIEGIQIHEGPIAALREAKEQVRLADLELAELRQSTEPRAARAIDELETVRGAVVEVADNIIEGINEMGDLGLVKEARTVIGGEGVEGATFGPRGGTVRDILYEGYEGDVAAARARRTPSKADPVEAVRVAIEELQARKPEPIPEATTPRDTIWAHQRRAAALAESPTGSGGIVSFHVSSKGGMRPAAKMRKVSAEALEAGVLDSVEGLSGTRWPHTPKRQLGYEFEQHAVPISSQTGAATRGTKKLDTAKRDPKPTILPEEALDMIRDLNEIFGEDGAILRGIVTEEGLAQQVIASIELELANQFASPTGRATVVEAVVEQANTSYWGGKMPRAIKKTMSETVSEALNEASGRRRGEAGTSSVYNPIFLLEGPQGRTVRVNSAQALARQQKSDPAFRAKIQQEQLDYVSERIGAQAKAKGIQDGVMNAIVRDSDVVGKTEYAMAEASERAAMRAEALKGSKEVQKHTRLKRKLEKERAKPEKEQDAAAIDRMNDELHKMENGTAAEPGLVDTYLKGIIDTYLRTGDRPTTWLFGDALEYAWNRLVEKSPESMKGLWMLREHLKPRNASKVFGSGLTGDQALMSTYFGFTKPSAQAQAAFRRAAAKPFADVTQLMPDRWISEPLYKVSELMARDAGVLPAMFAFKGLERWWRAVKLGKVAGNPGSHIMAVGSNTLLQMQRRGDLFIAAKAAGVLVDYMRFKAGMKTLIDPQIYLAMEHSGRVSGAMIKGEIDANLKRMLDNPDFATKDWAGDFMTAGIGRRVYDWWDTMFKLEDGVNQWGRLMEEWNSMRAGTPKNPVEYHFAISRTKTVKAQKIHGKMVVDGRVLTDAQFRHMMGRAAMEPGSRFLVDFKDVPLLAIFKRNFPLLDMMMSDFSTWRMVTDTFPFLKEGIFGEIMLGPTRRGYTSEPAIRIARSAEMGIANTARTMMAASLSERVSGEDHQMMRAMLNRYGGASPVYAFSATADPRVGSISNGTSFSVYESVERWLRTAEALAYTAPSKGTLGGLVQEWVGYLKPDATIDIPGLEGKEATTQMAFFLGPSQLERLSPAQRRHVEQSMAYWKDNAKTGGMGRKASMGLAYLEGNLYLNMVMNMFFETRREAEMGWNLSTADLIINTFAPRWGSGLLLYGLETKAAGDRAKYNAAVANMAKEEKRIKAIPETERSEKDKSVLKKLKDPQRMKDLMRKHLAFASGVSAITRHEYRPEAILGALDPSLDETPLRRLAQRWLHSPRAVAFFHQYNVDLQTMEKTKKPRKGLEAVGFSFKDPAIENYIDRSVRQWGRGISDAVAIVKEATYTGQALDEEAMKAHKKIYKVGARIKALETRFRKILTEEAQGMQKRWQDMFGQLELKAEQKGLHRAPSELRRSRGEHKLPTTGWTEEPEPTLPGQELFVPPQ